LNKGSHALTLISVVHYLLLTVLYFPVYDASGMFGQQKKTEVNWLRSQITCDE